MGQRGAGTEPVDAFFVAIGSIRGSSVEDLGGGEGCREGRGARFAAETAATTAGQVSDPLGSQRNQSTKGERIRYI